MTRREDEELFHAAMRTDLHSFAQRCFATLHPGVQFLPNWHIEAIVHHLALVQAGVIRRLIINLPPRSLKSLLASVVLPAFVLGGDPSKRIIAASYSSDLATHFSNQTRMVMKQRWYLKTFPRTRISRSKDTETEFQTTQHGYRLATSVGGSLTGRGANLIIVDDPLKAQDASSDSKREEANAWFANTLISRLDDKRADAIMVVMQRLHVDDLTGSLLRSSDDWVVLNLPAIAEERQAIAIDEDRTHVRNAGDVLHPEREPLSVLNEVRRAIGSDNFAAQFQQNPTPPDGNLIKREWIKRYDDLPARPRTLVLQSYDTASKPGGENSWTVCTTWYVYGKEYYLVDVHRVRCDYPTLKKDATALYRRFDPSVILIEEAGIGDALITELNGLGLPTVAVRPTITKIDRMSVQSSKFEGGQVFFPTDAPWLGELEAELLAFPNSRFNDQVDSISQALGHPRPQDGWNEKSCEGFSRLVDGLAMDSLFGRLAGRPW